MRDKGGRMLRGVLLLSLVLAFTGCQSKSVENTVVSQNDQKDAAKKLFAQGVLMLQQQNLKGAVESFQASIKLDPTDPNAYLIMGQILLNAQQFDQAVQFLDQTAKNFPNNGAVFYMLSIANRMDGKILPAVLAARRSFDLNKADGNQEMAQKTAILLEELIKEGQAMQAKEGSSESQEKMIKSKETNPKK